MFETSEFVYGLSVGFDVGYFWCIKPVNLHGLSVGFDVGCGSEYRLQSS